MQRMDANRSRSQSPGAVRDGPALLAGLARSLRALRQEDDRQLPARPGRQAAAGLCVRPRKERLRGRSVPQQIAGSCVDAHVTDLLLAAMAPAALEVSSAAAEQATAQRAQVDRIWRQRLERADFAADRARRQYQLAEPENRLVVRQLEKDGSRAGRAAAAGRGIRPLRRRPPPDPDNRRTRADPGPGRRPASGLACAYHHQRRPQATDPPPDRAGPHHGARHQREGGRPGGMGGRAPHGRADYPPGSLPDPAQLLPQFAARPASLPTADAPARRSPSASTPRASARPSASPPSPPARSPACCGPSASTAPIPHPRQPPRAGSAPLVATRPGRAPGHVRRSPSTPGSGAAGPPATCTRISSGQWCGPTPPRSNGCAPCTTCPAASTTAVPG